ncbi:MAG: HAD family hydrolase [Elusimicrobiota bacterium]
MNKKKIAVFMDRDGTINVEGGYINHEDRYELLPNTAKAIKRLNDNKVLAIVCTNQAGVARGYFKESLVKIVHAKLKSLLSEKGARVDDIFYCPHHPNLGGKYRKKCDCRKPGLGMIKKAEKKYNIDVKSSYVVGDKISDIVWGHRAGAKGVMVLTGYGSGEYKYQRRDWKDLPDFIAKDLNEAVKWILNDIKKRPVS